MSFETKTQNRPLSRNASLSYTYVDGTNQIDSITASTALGNNTLEVQYGDILNAQMPDVVYIEKRNGNTARSYEYDDLGRLKQIISKPGNGSLYTTFDYRDISGERTTTQVVGMSTGAKGFQYSYDARGNISLIFDGEYYTSYEYDALDQLIRENNQRENKTFVYTYSNGNIVSRKEYAYTIGTLGTVIKTDSWTYGDSDWGDVLTAYNGTSTAVENGRITSLGGKSIAYSYLGLISDAGNTHYSYDTSGRRLKKTTGTTVTQYYYAGDMLVGEKTGANKIEFIYDSNGNYYGFEYNDVIYNYIKNLQGDVIAIADTNGNIIVSYYYDAWGRLLEMDDDSSNGIGSINPIRYRGYYYDAETGFYYLKSRYYSPEICRFLTPDGIIDGRDVNTFNQFSYCANNPVTRIDYNGHFFTWNDIVEGVKTGVKWFATNVVMPVVETVKETMESFGDGTRTVGINGSVALGINFSGSVGISTDNKGNIGFVASGCFGGGTPSASLCVFESITTAPEIYNLIGDSTQIGGSADMLGLSVGAEYSFFQDSKTNKMYHGSTVFAGIGAPIPAEIHGECGRSVVYGFNIFDFFKNIYNKIMEW